MADLHGKRVVVTRPRLQAAGIAQSLAEAGAVPIFFPVIEISPILDPQELDQAIQNLDHYDWLILTSVNGVEAFWGRCKLSGQMDLPERLRIAAIGPKTAAALVTRGVKPNFVPEEYVAEAILPGLGKIAGRKFLLPRAKLARPDLAIAIREAGGETHEIAAYRTLPAQPDPDGLAALRAGVDIVTFTSSSTVTNFSLLVREAGLDPLNLPGNPVFACIGPITARTAEEEGYPVSMVAAEYTSEGLLNTLFHNFGEEKNERNVG